MKDELVPAKDVAVYWIEHVIRHGGTKHLQSKAKDMPFYKLYMLDVWALIVAVFLAIFYSVCKLVSCMKKGCLLKDSKLKNQ
jgi:glucuronosyltransferase